VDPQFAVLDATQVPTWAGVPSYLAAIKALRPFISEERRAKMDEVFFDLLLDFV